MLNKSLYIDSQDQLKHLQYIELLAKELNRPVQEITFMYEDVLMHLKEQAKIQNYLAIFASRRVRSIFNNASERRSGNQNSANAQIGPSPQVQAYVKAQRGRAGA